MVASSFLLLSFPFPPPQMPPLPLSSAALSPPLQLAPYTFVLPQPTVPTPMQSFLPSHGVSLAPVGSLGFYSSPLVGSTGLHSAHFLAALDETYDPSWSFGSSLLLDLSSINPIL